MNKHKKMACAVKAAIIAVGLAGALQSIPVHADSIHKAKEGDTFYLLAKKYGVDMNKLISANPGVNATNVYGGLDIVIPGTGSNSIVSMASASANETQSPQTLPALKVSTSDQVVEAWGKSFSYTKTIDVKATAYSSAAGENGKWGAVDYFGDPLQLGTIAVDPKVIPMGTKVLVTGHSHANLPKKAFVATATDQGGAIKGNRIDIFIPGSQQSVSHFGFQDVKLYVIK
ncbi:3D (Asp-Asp-Asp) domain-containing protein [Fontibacillus phaseoli]|uniref:3D (Asp-Asp-Asp) domain-containing protein n=1 Tax=Fontibacillus phaseoli TaxID=1416533 RepID=A0A369BRA3_9BACL|nr:3D domain-containing protein [Fontibacillus phaseoli]RCX23585.1 3D (Asp-Asp-Asp) domain-containing protein [Fontibacillus phaseoli]